MPSFTAREILASHHSEMHAAHVAEKTAGTDTTGKQTTGGTEDRTTAGHFSLPPFQDDGISLSYM